MNSKLVSLWINKCLVPSLPIAWKIQPFQFYEIKNVLIPEESDFVAREVHRHQINDVLFVLQY